MKHEIPTSKTRSGKKNQLPEENIKFQELGDTYDNWMNLGNDGKQNDAQKKVTKKGKKTKMFFRDKNE